MKIEQIYTKCLSEAAYYIESEGEVVIIDPMRETEPYTSRAKENNAQIKYILETHFHADFVSGHVDLAKKTGATIVYGPTAKTGFDFHCAQDGEILKVGKIKIKVLHTPGHTLESTTYLLIDQNGKDHAIFTGDTLFIGDVGRPDLAVSNELTKEELAAMLYESLHTKILPLADDVIVYPAHGAGSACGKNLSKETFDTLGNQRKTNYALKAETREDFIKQVTDGIVPPPQYFPKNAVLNKTGYSNIDDVIDKGVKVLSAEEVSIEMEAGTLLIDTRHLSVFDKAFVPNAIFFGLDGGFAGWVGTLIPELDTRIIVLTEPGREEEAVLRLARVGYDNTIGFLEGGIEAWEKAGKKVDSITSISAEELYAKMKKGEVENILDVRKFSEFEAEHAERAEHFPLDEINTHIHQLDSKKTYFIHCKSGYRSLIATSILQKNGHQNLINIKGGFDAILKTEIPKTEFVCPSTI